MIDTKRGEKEKITKRSKYITEVGEACLKKRE